MEEKPSALRAGEDEPVELVSMQVVGQGLREGPSVPRRVRMSRAEPTPPPPRRTYFGSWMKTPVIRRSHLSNPPNRPLLIHAYHATCLLPPSATASLNP